MPLPSLFDPRRTFLTVGGLGGGTTVPSLAFDNRRIRRGHNCPLTHVFDMEEQEGAVVAPSLMFREWRTGRGHDCPLTHFLTTGEPGEDTTVPTTSFQLQYLGRSNVYT